jgi:hypothetical protein
MKRLSSGILFVSSALLLRVVDFAAGQGHGLEYLLVAESGLHIRLFHRFLRGCRFFLIRFHHFTPGGWNGVILSE